MVAVQAAIQVTVMVAVQAAIQVGYLVAVLAAVLVAVLAAVQVVKSFAATWRAWRGFRRARLTISLRE